ncbi:MAG: hypothetical protein NT083_00315 [Rhodocyclales bacterium]|nr:hypothetical protein [Rhodocyclales bacterium]
MSHWLTIKNWSEFQHYKDRNPPWIKLHRALLDDYAFAALPDAQKAHLVLLWLFAASQTGGRIPNDSAFLSRKLGTTEQIDLESLVIAGFLIPEQTASDVIAERKQDASNVLALARSRESETESEKNSCAVSPHVSKDALQGFSDCWNAYPKRSGGNSRKEAAKAYRARLKTGVSPADMLAGVHRYAAYIRGTEREGTAYVKQTSTFFGTGEHWRESWELPGTSAASADWRKDPAFRGCA